MRDGDLPRKTQLLAVQEAALRHRRKLISKRDDLTAAIALARTMEQDAIRFYTHMLDMIAPDSVKSSTICSHSW